MENSLRECDELEFNCFDFHDLTKGSGVNFLLGYLFGRYNLFESLNIEPMTLSSFSKKVEGGYVFFCYFNQRYLTEN